MRLPSPSSAKCDQIVGEFSAAAAARVRRSSTARKGLGRHLFQVFRHVVTRELSLQQRAIDDLDPDMGDGVQADALRN